MRNSHREVAQSAVRAGAQLLLGIQVVRCVPDAKGGFLLNLASEQNRVEKIHADFVIDATGRGSTVARRLGASSIMFDRLVGVAAQFTNARAETSCYTLVESTPDGWWYSAPAGNDRSMTMLMTDGDLVCSQGTRELPQWWNALNRAELTRASIDGCERKWGPRVFSAVSQRLQRNDETQERWLAVGDAALAVDPISGSGVVRALRTARAAASTVLSSLSGDKTAIAHYEADRDRSAPSICLSGRVIIKLNDAGPMRRSGNGALTRPNSLLYRGAEATEPGATGNVIIKERNNLAG